MSDPEPTAEAREVAYRQAEADLVSHLQDEFDEEAREEATQRRFDESWGYGGTNRVRSGG